MNRTEKLYGEERRMKILELLQNSQAPITGSELSRLTNVSRQVIVGDITLLKAMNEPIIATSQGYLYMNTGEDRHTCERVIACRHTPGLTEAELNLIVDSGVTVKDVKVEHPVYGDLTASIMVSNRRQVKQFIEKMEATGASLLSELTGGVHLHTITAATESQLDEVIEALKQEGFLAMDND